VPPRSPIERPAHGCLTRRCSGLASLAAERHIVRPHGQSLVAPRLPESPRDRHSTIGDSRRMNQTLNRYLSLVLCTCPQCGGVARARYRNASASEMPFVLVSASVSCTLCGYSRGWLRSPSESPIFVYNPRTCRAPIFGLPLALVASVRGHSLIALNGMHVRDLRAYVASGIRPTAQNRKWAMIARLPKWVKAASNRPHVLRALDRFQKTLESAKGGAA
jgi:hypothetical protein